MERSFRKRAPRSMSVGYRHEGLVAVDAAASGACGNVQLKCRATPYPKMMIRQGAITHTLSRMKPATIGELNIDIKVGDTIDAP
jgi:hypothetical protein